MQNNKNLDSNENSNEIESSAVSKKNDTKSHKSDKITESKALLCNEIEDSSSQRQPCSNLDRFLSCMKVKLKKICGCSDKTVSILRLQGVIGKVGFSSGLTLESLNTAIEAAFKPSNLLAVCVIVNSPGGSPVQSELIAKRITSLSEQKKVPVYSFIEDMAASGGYWLACAGKEIYASQSSIIGSIGVVSRAFGLQELIKKFGIERRVYTQGTNKSILDPFMPEKKEDIVILNNAQKQIYRHFTNYVKTQRDGKLTQSDDVLFNGAFWAGSQALEFGLIDGINDVYSFIKDRFGDKVKIKYCKLQQSWIKKKLSINSEDITNNLLHKLEEKIISDKFSY